MTMRTIVAGAALAAASVNLAALDYALHEETTITRTLQFGGDGARVLDVRNLHGSIRVTGSGGSAVDFRARRTIGANTREDLRRGEREAVLSFIDGLPAIEAVVQEPNGPICGEEWEGGWRRRPRYQVTYDMTIAVPARTRLRLCTMNGREIVVDGTTGDFDIENVNGEIAMREVRGSGSATTVNGRVTASFLDVPRLDAEFRSVNGDISITWPASLAAHLRMKTFNGGLFTDFTPLPAGAQRVPPVKRGDRFEYRSASFTDVQVGRGGPTITLETLNGNIRVLQGSR